MVMPISHWLVKINLQANARAYLSTSGRRRGQSDHITVDPSDMKHKDKKTIRVNLMPYDFTDPSQYPFVSDITPDAWGYPFHSACWKILTIIGPIDQEDLQSILNLCRSVPKQMGMLNWGHEYGGRAKHHLNVAPGEENFLISSPVVVGMDINPCSIVELMQIFDSLMSNKTEDDFPTIHPLLKLHQVTAHDPFTDLPTDILLALADHLTLPELTLMKQSSRAFTNLELPSRFWRKRFRLGREFDYIFEAQDYSGGKWESICRDINASKSNGMVRYSLHIRRHIWDLCFPMRQVLGAMRYNTCDGTPVKSIFEPEALPDALPEGKGWITVDRARKFPGEIFERGSRVIYDRMVVLPRKLCAVYVSTIQLFGRHYVSGLRFRDRDGMYLNVGFQHPEQELLLAQEDSGLQIQGFDVAFDQRGVKGLSMLLGDGTQSDWVGEYKNIPKKRLQISSGEDGVSHFKGGFDAAKLVAISINEASSYLADLQASPEQGIRALWYPEIPSPDLIFPCISTALSHNSNHSSVVDQDLPVCFRLFGDGDPGILSQITVRHRVHDKYTLKMESITMISADKSEAELGFRRTDGRYSKDYDINHEHEESFDIDGPGGERIENVRTCWSYGLFVGFELKTNRDRTVKFTGGSDHEDDWEDGSTFNAGGRKVVGFWAQMETDPGFLLFGPVIR
ncbi:hypothetical protein FBEOM_6186 [Fusarium beomiforme]|uniref:F-box domain-containing protein n=1 Tax=Fusarium beomiforme TaxID=44412 RepID=A0A9P5AJL0_9HYPO|nr:hypothetical protein FBEOM_6186 [Fusarium beomiforme]